MKMDASLAVNSTCKPMQRKRSAGFRFSVRDGIALVAFALLAVYLGIQSRQLAGLVATVAGHFFLFCNIFRIRRSFELTWAGLYIANAAGWVWFNEYDWLRVLLAQVPITTVFLFIEMRSPRYHGIFSHRINPLLADYLEGKPL